MSRLRAVSACACLVLLLSADWANAQMPRRVTAIGRAAGTSVRSQDEALADAQRKAVEQACGLFINAQSNTEDYALVKDRILSQAGGYVNEFTELRRWTEGDVSLIEIQATVSVVDFERDWASFIHAKEDEGNPRMVVIILEDNDVDDLKDPIFNGICQSKFENFFLSKDVQLMDQGVIDQVRSRDLELAAMSDDIAKLAAIAGEFKAEVLVFGRAEAKRGGSTPIGGISTTRWDVSLNIRAVQSDSAAVLMSNTYRLEKPYRTTAGAAGDDAFHALSDEVAPQVLQDIGQAWHKRATARRILTVRFDGVSHSELRAICDALGRHRGVVGGAEGVERRNFSHRVAEVGVDWKFDMTLLTDTIADLQVEGLGFEIVEESANRLDVKVVH